MDFRDFDRTKPRDLPGDVSPVYFHLYEKVRERGGQDVAQVIAFCVAYTIYCTRKKERIFTAKRNGDANVSLMFKPFEEDWAQEHAIDEAKKILEELITTLKAAAIATLIGEVRNIVHPRVPWWQRLLFFLLNSLLHVAYLIVGTIILIAILKGVALLWPSIVTAFIDNASHALELIGHVVDSIRPSK